MVSDNEWSVDWPASYQAKNILYYIDQWMVPCLLPDQLTSHHPTPSRGPWLGGGVVLTDLLIR